MGKIEEMSDGFQENLLSKKKVQTDNWILKVEWTYKIDNAFLKSFDAVEKKFNCVSRDFSQV